MAVRFWAPQGANGTLQNTLCKRVCKRAISACWRRVLALSDVPQSLLRRILLCVAVPGIQETCVPGQGSRWVESWVFGYICLPSTPTPPRLTSVHMAFSFKKYLDYL